ncbi:MAG: CpsD/CapB family tyrosine-protein kinase [Pyrinomonadaceae bacterium]
MGRVFDALKKASAIDKPGAAKQKQISPERRDGRPAVAGLPTASQVEEQLLKGSSFMTAASEPARSSASTAHTADVPDGSALPGGFASRDAGATLDAAGAARVGRTVSYDITPTRVEPHLVAVSQPRSAYCEQFRSLRTRILQAGERQDQHAFVVTSAGIAEGKTLMALNLAWLLAQTEGVRALLIDSDLRNPCATDYLGIEETIGLSEVLGGRATLDEAIVQLKPSGLYLLPGGQPRDDVAELLSGPSYERLLGDVRRMFDYIIIDAPPLGVFTDANVLISRADAAMLVVRAGKTRYSVVDRLLEQIPRDRLLGVVLNRVDEQFDTASYYYQHRYYKRDRMVPETKSAVQEEVVVAN